MNDRIKSALSSPITATAHKLSLWGTMGLVLVLLSTVPLTQMVLDAPLKEALLEHTHPTVIAGDNGKIVFANKAASDILDIPREELCGRPISDIDEDSSIHILKIAECEDVK